MSTLLNWIDATRWTMAVAAAAFACAAAASADYPNQPIRLIVPAAPGVVSTSTRGRSRRRWRRYCTSRS